MKTLLLTGLPRSGTSVLSALIDALPDVACLNAPQWIEQQTSKLTSPVTFTKWLIGDVVWRKRELINGEQIRDLRAPDFSALMDSVNDTRITKNSKGEPVAQLFSRQGLSENMTLALRFPGLMVALLPHLARSGFFDITVMIRNPIDMLRSWVLLDKQNKLEPLFHHASLYWPELERLLATPHKREEAFVQIMELFFARYFEHQQDVRIVRYEDLLENPLVVSQIVGSDNLSPAVSKLRKPRPPVENDHYASLIEQYGDKIKAFYKVAA